MLILWRIWRYLDIEIGMHLDIFGSGSRKWQKHMYNHLQLYYQFVWNGLCIFIPSVLCHSMNRLQYEKANFNISWIITMLVG